MTNDVIIQVLKEILEDSPIERDKIQDLIDKLSKPRVCGTGPCELEEGHKGPHWSK